MPPRRWLRWTMPAFHAAASTTLPEGEGKQLVENGPIPSPWTRKPRQGSRKRIRRNCHGVATVAQTRMTRQQRRLRQKTDRPRSRGHSGGDPVGRRLSGQVPRPIAAVTPGGKR